MPAQGIDPDRHIVHSRLPEGIGGLKNAFSVVTHRIVAAGNEENRQILAHGPQIHRLLNERDPFHHIPQQSGTGSEAAERMGDVRVHDSGIPGQPVKGRPGMLHLLIIAAKNQILKLLIGLGLPCFFADGLHKPDGRRQREGWLPARSADDRGGDAAVGILAQQRPGHERTHGMPEQDVGKIGKFLPGIRKQLEGILHSGEPPAVEIALNAVTVDGLAMAHMVLGHHQISLLRQIIGKAVVTLDKLGDAMYDLEHRFGFPLRGPPADMDPAGAMRIKPTVRTHTFHPTTS